MEPTTMPCMPRRSPMVRLILHRSTDPSANRGQAEPLAHNSQTLATNNAGTALSVLCPRRLIVHHSRVVAAMLDSDSDDDEGGLESKAASTDAQSLVPVDMLNWSRPVVNLALTILHDHDHTEHLDERRQKISRQRESHLGDGSEPRQWSMWAKLLHWSDQFDVPVVRATCVDALASWVAVEHGSRRTPPSCRIDQWAHALNTAVRHNLWGAPATIRPSGPSASGLRCTPEHRPQRRSRTGTARHDGPTLEGLFACVPHRPMLRWLRTSRAFARLDLPAAAVLLSSDALRVREADVARAAARWYAFNTDCVLAPDAGESGAVSKHLFGELVGCVRCKALRERLQQRLWERVAEVHPDASTRLSADGALSAPAGDERKTCDHDDSDSDTSGGADYQSAHSMCWSLRQARSGRPGCCGPTGRRMTSATPQRATPTPRLASSRELRGKGAGRRAGSATTPHLVHWAQTTGAVGRQKCRLAQAGHVRRLVACDGAHYHPGSLLRVYCSMHGSNNRDCGTCIKARTGTIGRWTCCGAEQQLGHVACTATLKTTEPVGKGPHSLEPEPDSAAAGASWSEATHHEVTALTAVSTPKTNVVGCCRCAAAR